MPIYEYRCEECGHEIEVLQKLSDDPLKECPSCEHSALKKKVSAAAFRLKGGGWYETDFKSGNKKNLATLEKSPDKKGDGSAKDSSTTDSAKKDSASTSGNVSSSGSESKNAKSSK